MAHEIVPSFESEVKKHFPPGDDGCAFAYLDDGGRVATPDDGLGEFIASLFVIGIFCFLFAMFDEGKETKNAA